VTIAIRPSWWARDARKHAFDLPDVTSEIACDISTRRANHLPRAKKSQGQSSRVPGASPVSLHVVLFVRCLVDNGPRQTMTAALWIAAARRRHAKSAEPATFILAAAAIMPNAIPNRQRKLCFATGEIRLQKGSVRMRQEQQSLSPAQRAADFNINFQITDAGARRACSVTIEAASRFDAEIIFRQNWTTIEQLARLNLAAKDRNEISWRRVQDGVAAAATVK
jgi:hypothetical protein